MLMILLALVQATAEPVGELGEVLRKEPVATFTTERSIDALELCMGDKISKYGVPSALRGEGEVVVSAWLATNFGAYTRVVVHIADDGRARTVHVRTRKGREMEPDLRELVTACI